jgi:hypothetical protein
MSPIISINYEIFYNFYMQDAFSINPDFNTMTSSEGISERVNESSLQGERLDYMVQRHGKTVKQMLGVPDSRCVSRFVKYVGEEAVGFLADQGAIFAEPKRNALITTVEEKVGAYDGPSMDVIFTGSEPSADHIAFIKMADKYAVYQTEVAKAPFDRFVSINYMFLGDYLNLPDKKLLGLVRSIDNEKAIIAYSKRRESTDGVDIEARAFLNNMMELIGKIDPSTGILLYFERFLHGPNRDIDIEATSRLYEKYDRYFKKRGHNNVSIAPPIAVRAYRQSIQQAI